jgi:CheY-like chemotaxis protein
VLVVDDDPDLREMVATALERRGYRIETAEDGEDALRRAAEAEPQLVLLDMRMPVMDGWAFARTFRERFGPDIPIIVVTAAHDATLSAHEIGADACLDKPFDVHRLEEVVDRAVGKPN